MKFLDDYIRFETEYKTQIMQVKDGLQWKFMGDTKIIRREALGIYKRYNVDMYKVLKMITFNSEYNGSERSALQIVKKLKRKEQEQINNNEERKIK